MLACAGSRLVGVNRIGTSRKPPRARVFVTGSQAKTAPSGEAETRTVVSSTPRFRIVQIRVAPWPIATGENLTAAGSAATSTIGHGPAVTVVSATICRPLIPQSQGMRLRLGPPRMKQPWSSTGSAGLIGTSTSKCRCWPWAIRRHPRGRAVGPPPLACPRPDRHGQRCPGACGCTWSTRRWGARSRRSCCCTDGRPAGSGRTRPVPGAGCRLPPRPPGTSRHRRYRLVEAIGRQVSALVTVHLCGGAVDVRDPVHPGRSPLQTQRSRWAPGRLWVCGIG